MCRYRTASWWKKRKARIGWTNSATLISIIEQGNCQHLNRVAELDKRSSSLWPSDRENLENPILLCHYRKGHTPTKALCLSSRGKTCWDRTTLSYASQGYQSCFASTCHSCITSAQHSVEASDSAVAPITTDSCASSYPRNNTGRVRTSTKSKPCSPDNSVRKNCDTSRTPEFLVEHWTVWASVLHINIWCVVISSLVVRFVVFS